MWKSMHKPQMYRVQGPLCIAKSEGCIGDAEQIFCQGLLRVYQKCFWHPNIVCSELTYWLKHKSVHRPQIYRVQSLLCNAKSESCIGVTEQIFCQALLRVYQKYFWHPRNVCSELTYWLKHKSVHKPQIYRVRGPLCNAKSEGKIRDEKKCSARVCQVCMDNTDGILWL
jgi:hypothetical protein